MKLPWLQEIPTESITVYIVTGKQPSGDPIIGDLISCEGYVEHERKMVVDRTGQQVVSTTQLYIFDALPILEISQTLFSLEGSIQKYAKDILAYRSVVDVPAHVEVYL